MKYDSYSRFLKSQLYKDCLMNEMEGNLIETCCTSMSAVGLEGSHATNCTSNNNGNNTNLELVVKQPLSYSSSLNSTNSKSSATMAFGQRLSSTSQNSNEIATLPGHSVPTSNGVAGAHGANERKKKNTILLPWTKGNET